MSQISYRSRSYSDEDASSEDRSSERFIEWGDDVDLHEQILDSDSEYKIIEMASRKLLLSTVLAKYKISMEEQYNSTGWTHKCACPFPDHKEKEPSFGFNPKEDRFNCFGCNRGGRSVQFISIMENKNQIDVAREIISSLPEDEDIYFLAEQIDFNKVEDILFEYADMLRKFKQQNDCSIEAIKYSEGITWNLDLYLRATVPNGTISLTSLEARIALLKEELECYGDPE